MLFSERLTTRVDQEKWKWVRSKASMMRRRLFIAYGLVNRMYENEILLHALGLT